MWRILFAVIAVVLFWQLLPPLCRIFGFDVSGDVLTVVRVVVAVDPKYFRPTEVDLLIGDPTKAKTKLGWEPRYDLKGLVNDMMSSDLNLYKRDKYLQKGGHKVMNYYEL